MSVILALRWVEIGGLLGLAGHPSRPSFSFKGMLWTVIEQNNPHPLNPPHTHFLPPTRESSGKRIWLIQGDCFEEFYCYRNYFPGRTKWHSALSCYNRPLWSRSCHDLVNSGLFGTTRVQSK